MKKSVLAFIIASMSITFVACGNGNQEAANVENESEVVQESSEVENTTENSSEQESELPAYEYPGPELFYTVLYDYMVEELGQQYPETGVKIPCPIIIKEDESDKEDIKVYGNFCIYGYNLKDDILECENGGSYPGCIHLKFTEEGYEVTGMDVVADGSDFDESAKEIFGEYYDEFMKVNSDSDSRDEIRAQIISNYVYANNLSITAFQDYGWDPVTLPEQNIDSFYSTLD